MGSLFKDDILLFLAIPENGGWLPALTALFRDDIPLFLASPFLVCSLCQT